jgi:hypothetical protein
LAGERVEHTARRRRSAQHLNVVALEHREGVALELRGLRPGGAPVVRHEGAGLEQLVDGDAGLACVD